MNYWNYKSDYIKNAGEKVFNHIDAILEKGITKHDIGAHPLFYRGKLESVELCTVSGNSWTHLAVIINTGKGFMLAENFVPVTDEKSPWYGTEQTQQNIFGHFKTLGGALRNLMKFGTTATTGRKPVEVYI